MERKKNSWLPQQKSCFNRGSSLESVALQNAREAESFAHEMWRERLGKQSAEWVCQSHTYTGMDVYGCLYKIKGIPGIAQMLEALCVNSWLAQRWLLKSDGKDSRL